MENKDFEISNISDIKDDFPQKRDCLSEIINYLNSDNNKRICGIYGLRRTGKTTLMRQALLSLPKKERDKAIFITCEKESNFRRILEFLKDSSTHGKKYFFIDEITFSDKFQLLAEVLSDNLADLKGAKIVVTGTDSLGLSLASHSNLYDRITMVHTTYMPFAEYARITGNKSIDHYIKHGSTLSQPSPFETKSSATEYIETSIIENFIKSIEKSEGVRSYPPPLTELYENSELENAIQRIINQYTQTISLKSLRKQFKLSPLENGLDVVAKHPDEPPMINDGDLNTTQITEKVKKLLKIDTFRTSLTKKHLESVKELLKEMDVITVVPVKTSFLNQNSEQEEDNPALELLSHPGMYHANLGYTIEQLKSNANWLPSVSQSDRKLFLDKVYKSSAGIIMENFIIADVYKMLDKKGGYCEDLGYAKQYRWYVSKLSARIENHDEEVDLIVCDRKKKETFIFEIKHSNQSSKEQSKHLESKLFLTHIEKNFGKVKIAAVLYNGQTDMSFMTPRLNVSDFLIDIYEHAEEPNYSISDTVQRLSDSTRILKQKTLTNQTLGEQYIENVLKYSEKMPLREAIKKTEQELINASPVDSIIRKQMLKSHLRTIGVNNNKEFAAYIKNKKAEQTKSVKTSIRKPHRNHRGSASGRSGC